MCQRMLTFVRAGGHSVGRTGSGGAWGDPGVEKRTKFWGRSRSTAAVKTGRKNKNRRPWFWGWKTDQVAWPKNGPHILLCIYGAGKRPRFLSNDAGPTWGRKTALLFGAKNGPHVLLTDCGAEKRPQFQGRKTGSIFGPPIFGSRPVSGSAGAIWADLGGRVCGLGVEGSGGLGARSALGEG